MPISLSVSALVVSTTNTIGSSGGTDAYIEGGWATAVGDVAVKATDDAQLFSHITAVGVTVSLINVSYVEVVSDNTINASTDAYIKDAAVTSTGGGIEIRADSDDFVHSETIGASVSVGIGGRGGRGQLQADHIGGCAGASQQEGGEGAADQPAVHVGQGEQLGRVGGLHAAPVLDAQRLGHRLAGHLGEDLVDRHLVDRRFDRAIPSKNADPHGHDHDRRHRQHRAHPPRASSIHGFDFAGDSPHDLLGLRRPVGLVGRQLLSARLDEPTELGHLGAALHAGREVFPAFGVDLEAGDGRQLPQGEVFGVVPVDVASDPLEASVVGKGGLVDLSGVEHGSRLLAA